MNERRNMVTPTYYTRHLLMEFLEVYSPDSWHPRPEAALAPPSFRKLSEVCHHILSYNGVVITPLKLLLQLTIKALIPFPIL
jgi:hypothetical protein